MNSTELLDQFVDESRECLESIAQRLLDVERDPGNGRLLNDLFRLVHTLKGNCGLFDFKPLEQVFHAGEDLLDEVRSHALAYTDTIADALLAAMDYATDLIEAIADSGELPAECHARSATLATSLRSFLHARELPTAPQVPAVHGTAGVGDADGRAWIARLRPGLDVTGIRVVVRYRPESECFFKGEDPWHLACTLPGTVHIDVQPAEPWQLDGIFDCYRCNLDIVIASTAELSEVLEHLRYVPEQIGYLSGAALTRMLVSSDAGLTVREAAPAVSGQGADAAADSAPSRAADIATQVMRSTIARLWQAQMALLGSASAPATVVASVRESFMGLLNCFAHDAAARSASAALPAPGCARGDLAAWAEHYGPRTDGSWTAAAESRATGADGPTAKAQATTAKSASGAADAAAGADRTQRVLKVGQEKIDRIMDLIGEMVVAKNALPYLADRAETVFGQRELAREIKSHYSVINRIADDMQHAIMQVRMLPIGTIFQRFNRLIRDISKRLDKEVELVIVGEDTEADKNLIEALADPLIHILRNSLDHGIELPAVRRAAGKPSCGTLRVEARQESDRVILEISDDGAGVNTDRVRSKAVERGLIPADRARSLSEAEAVQLVFLPGFSTAETISDLSGRGVGMDVVRAAVEQINGTVELSSHRGKGTCIRLSLPLSMAVSNVMMIETAGRQFGVPMDLIAETVRIHTEDIHTFKTAQTTVLRGKVVPLQPLNRLLGLDAPPKVNVDGELALLVVRMGGENIGLLVDEFHGTSDIILKPLDGILAGLTGFAGTALMGDGSVLMILNPKELL